MNARHTPGPWIRRESKVSTTVTIETTHGLVIAEVGDSSLEDEANARLIAAAPELLEALSALLPHLPFSWCLEGAGMQMRVKAAHDAVNKATGSAA